MLTKGMESWRAKNRKCHSVINYVATSSVEIKLFLKKSNGKIDSYKTGLNATNTPFE